ncbi:hypothetical protein KBD81_01135 [Candidatus Woesebacteria bacterium]|nr:hypothetical protein [Candidatus Woesebacteria bacterium]
MNTLNLQKIVLTWVVFLLCSHVIHSPSRVEAYVPFSSAIAIALTDDFEIGSVVAYENGLYRLSNAPYDSKIIGVVVDTADIVVEEEGTPVGQALMVDRGEARILVTGEDGPIAEGDLLTSSSKPGYATKATRDGIMIGTALEAFSGTSDQDSSAIRAIIDTRFMTLGKVFTAESIGAGLQNRTAWSVSDLIGMGLGGLAGTSPFFRYILATLIVLVAFIYGFYLFGRIALRGLEALGRNPLARRTIITGIVINSFFAILLVGLALVLAYIIISVA